TRAIEKADARGTEQVLRHSTHDEVDAERLHIDRHGADRLKAVEHHERALRVSELHDAGDIQLHAIAKADVRDGDDARLLVDELLEVLKRDVALRVFGNVHDARPTRGLRVPDLTARG